MTLRVRTPELVLEDILARAYDKLADMLKVTSVQKKWRDSFSGSAVDASKWDVTTGAGASVSVSGGTITIASGTTANSETILLSKETFTVPFRISIGLRMSQRIANQTFYAEIVSVNPTTGVPDGQHSGGLVFDGTNAAQAKYAVRNGGLDQISGAVTFPTTASPGGVYEIEPFSDEAWFHGGTLDGVTSRANSYRKHQGIPDPNAVYKIRLRWLNGATAPASTTSAILAYVACQDYAELTAEVTAGRGQSSAGQGLGVIVCGQVDTELPTASALADSATNPTAPSIGSLGSMFNGTNWDRQRGNFASATGDTGAKTATGSGATQTNFNARGAIVVFNVGTVSGTSPTCVFKLQGSADGGTTWFDIPSAATPAISASGVVALAVYPGVTPAANAAVSYPLPRTWRVVWTLGGTSPSFTINNVQVAYIL